MNKIFYPLVATALVTIAPFLLTFEKGQDIVHGLFSYSTFALLLFLVFVHQSKIKYKVVALVIIVIALIAVSYIDLLNLLSYKDAYPWWIWVIPAVATVVAVVMLKDVKSLSLHAISFTLFLSLGVQILGNTLIPSQPIFETPLLRALSFFDNDVDRRYLSSYYQSAYDVKDTATITKNYLDASRNNVVILVESWGIPFDSLTFKKELDIFASSLQQMGIHHRMYSKTRTAEREDLLDSIYRRENGVKDSFFIPQRMVSNGIKTIYLYGGDSTYLHRNRYIRRIGFDDFVFSQNLLSDSLMSVKIDSLLNDSVALKFIAWTTRDTQFPMGEDVTLVEKAYFEKLFNTLRIIADLAQKHPETRFIVQGDHEPILSPRIFREKFYKRWTPFVVLN